MNKYKTKIKVLGVYLKEELVGYLTKYSQGQIYFHFDLDYINQGSNRKTFSLNYYKINSDRMRLPEQSYMKLPPVFSNLLPEKEMRKLAAQRLKIDSSNEFSMIEKMGNELPGSIVVKKIKEKDVPAYILSPKVEIEMIDEEPDEDDLASLAGVMVKFSMYEENGVQFLSKRNHLGAWIVKTPSNIHQGIPLNEFTAMSLAKIAGVNVPEFKLIEMKNIQELPDLKFGDEKFAYAIKRFDRENKNRIHSEDFAQIFNEYSSDKYGKYNYDTIANVIKNTFLDPLDDLKEFYARLVVNLMIGNGDAHLKNWSIYYPDKVNPKLSPAYDILFTRAYTTNDKSIAFNLGGEKINTKISLKNFKKMSEKISLDWKLVEGVVLDTITLARNEWPKNLDKLPMLDEHKNLLLEYWESLHPDFKIK